MSEEEKKTISLSAVQRIFTSRFDTYQVISQVYKLPDFTSRAITSNYLKALINEPWSLFRIEVKDFHPRYIPTKHVTSIEIIQWIEELSK